MTEPEIHTGYTLNQDGNLRRPTSPMDDPWVLAHWDEPGYRYIHVYPVTGREHLREPDCWCMPLCIDIPGQRRILTFRHNRPH